MAFDTSRLVGSPEDLRKLIAQETQRHRRVIDDTTYAISRLQALHNSLAPVNALPAELLGLIFAQLLSQGDLIPKAPRHFSRRLQVDPPRGSRDILGAAAVCRYWRAVIIQNPWLWVSFPIHDRIGVKEFLARSKDLLVSLSLTRRFPSGEAPVLAPSAHRIRSLYISTDLADDIELLTAELSCPAPNLQELFVEYLPRISSVTGRIDLATRLPSMFNGEAPALRVLTYRGVPSPCKVMPSSLLYLQIGMVQDALPPVPALLRMLSNLPLLETLKIHGFWEFEEIAQHAVVHNDIALPKLGAIDLNLEPQEAPGILLSSLALPAHTDVSITSILEEGCSVANVLETVAPTLAPLCFSGFRGLQLFRDGYWRVQAYRVPDAFFDPPALEILCADVWGDAHSPWPGFLVDWPFDVSQIETLVLSHKQETYHPIGGGEPVQMDRTFDRWGNTFRELPALKTLRVMGTPTSELETLLDALLERTSDSADKVCPNLSSLEIFDVQFSNKAGALLLNVAASRAPVGTRVSTLERVELFNSKPCGVGLSLCHKIIPFGVELVIDEEIMSTVAPD
ncbi:hypothetical protein GSI_07234 [Ganoderma sinense ZZ0214-1]|uniref:Uncharacterized protein n=1 Tax=Ganoderma sinense ZZ0214-1 TaxID=1077348 RepID=A0A2G8S9W3_9APHY|nr:hypothetical protein GSI_07234 [Ganoderma sinense ZZ0214-1]